MRLRERGGSAAPPELSPHATKTRPAPLVELPATPLLGGRRKKSAARGQADESRRARPPPSPSRVLGGGVAGRARESSSLATRTHPPLQDPERHRRRYRLLWRGNLPRCAPRRPLPRATAPRFPGRKLSRDPPQPPKPNKPSRRTFFCLAPTY